MTSLRFVTTRCRAADHPEITLLFRERRPVAVERMLLGYFEQGVAAGKRFLPGQTVQLGWATLRLCARDDGTIGVEERSGDGWVESCDQSLMQLWLQKEIAASVGLAGELAFPRQEQMALACDRALGVQSWLLTRSLPEGDADSGWMIGCFTDPQHDHALADALVTVPLVQVVERLPFVTQFLALPPGAAVYVDGTSGRIRPHVFVNGEARAPVPGSYLEALGA